MDKVQLDDARLFVAVVERQGFSAAARYLRQPKSSVSRAVSRLETALGVQLLKRTTRSLQLTEAGVRYHARVAPALGAVESASREVGELNDEPQGTLRITAPVDFGAARLATWVSEFTRRHPGVRVDAALTARHVDLIGEGFDLAIRAGRLADSSMVARKLAELSAGLFASEEYLARRGTPRRPADLLEHECVLFRPKKDRERWELVCGQKSERVDVTGPVAGDEYSFVHAAVLAGAGIGSLPTFLVNEQVETGNVVRVLPAWKQQRAGALYLVFSSARYLPRRVVVFRDFLLEKVGLETWDAS